MKPPAAHFALLEIGTEEIPARFLPPALAQLGELTGAGLKEANLPVAGIETWGTPRRLTVIIRGLASQAQDRVAEALGPPVAASKDAAGLWTQAALGFAKAQNISVEKLVMRETPKGPRLAALHEIKGQKTDAVLKDLFPSIISKLTFPKSMVWEKSGFRFARPIRWILALHNTKVVRFSLAGVTSDRYTIGLLALGGGRIPVTKPERYKTVLQGRCILVDPAARQKNIAAQMEAISKKIKATILADPAHLEEVANLTEYPVSILGEFPQKYLELPREVLVSVLKKQQKFFPIESSRGALTNTFVAVRNGPSESQEDVREGYERVINARLADAKFFFEQDQKVPLVELAPRLSEVGFHEKLGSMLNKTDRVRKLLANFVEFLELPKAAVAMADRAAFLSKADLLTHMVGEFPDLQGVAGRFYARVNEPPEVAQAIEEHYWPLTSEGPLPTNNVAALVSLSDKLDTLGADFSLGLAPTGSVDPYGLRRMAVGVIRILIDRKWEISLETLVQMAFENLPIDTGKREKGQKDLFDFFIQRVSNWLAHQGYRVDEIQAVLGIDGQSLCLIEEKLQGLKAVRGRPEFGSLAAAIKRARNILSQAKEKGVLPRDTDLVAGELSEPSEVALQTALSEVRPRMWDALQKKNFREALLALAPLKAPVDAFFDGVMVMVDDEKTRSQRLALLMNVKQLFDQIADFSELQTAHASAPDR